MPPMESAWRRQDLNPELLASCPVMSRSSSLQRGWLNPRSHYPVPPLCPLDRLLAWYVLVCGIHKLEDSRGLTRARSSLGHLAQ